MRDASAGQLGTLGRDMPVALDAARVVVADDEASTRMILDATLRNLGVGAVTLVEDGLACVALADSMEPPDLVVLDVVMPQLDGIETCRRLRAGPWRDVPIVMHTLLGAPEDRVRCFEAGATDLIAKPVFLPELRARLQVHLASRLMTRSLESFRRRLAGELRIAERMQRALLPDPARLAATLAPLGLTVDTGYQPCDEIGGDLWDVCRLDERHVSVLMLDLVGHGLVAAINAFRLRSVIETLDGYRALPALWLARLNDAVHERFAGEVLATALYGVIDVAAGRFTYASAGSPSPLHGSRRPDGTVEPRPLISSGLMLGVTGGVDYPERVVALGPGGFLLLFSDGLLADCGADAEPALIELTRRIGGAAPARPLEGIWEWRDSRAAGRRSDDVTMVWIGRGRGR